jgi:two-component sensor histidine kinase
MDLDLDIDIARDLTAPAQARSAIGDRCDRLDRDVAGDTVLLVSELVSNSVKYGAGETVSVRVRTRGTRQVLVDVTDEGGGFAPTATRPGRLQAGGFGLRLVDELANTWGVHPGTAHVWFEIDRSADLAAVA